MNSQLPDDDTLREWIGPYGRMYDDKEKQIKPLVEEVLRLRERVRELEEKQKPEELGPKDIMVRTGDKTFFRCDCKCNVFRSPVGKPDVFVCNACEARYIGEQP